MSYVSFQFLFFVTGTVLAYFLYPVIFRRKGEHQWLVLLAASWLFYWLCGGVYLWLILWTSLVIYLGARILQHLGEEQKRALADLKNQDPKNSGREKSGPFAAGGILSADAGTADDAAAGGKNADNVAAGRKTVKAQEREEKRRIRARFLRRKRIVLWSVLVMSFGILAFFKYVPGLVNALTRGQRTLSLLVPVGISFYTFQAAGYLIDVYNGNVKAEKSFFKTALFISFFPQIIQGPIGFWDPVAGDLFARHRPDWSRCKHGLELILWGYLRKMVLADRIVNDIYIVTGDYQKYSGSMAVLAVLLYALQLYADFAGGIDISRGIAEILGIRLPENFRQPYLATSINDYWRRWHITLGAWMKKYIFYPLALTPLFAAAGKKLGRTRFGHTDLGRHASKALPASLSCIVVFLVVGIWHGAGGRYVAFGLWNGLIIFASMLLEPLFPAWRSACGITALCGHRWGARLYRLFQILRTFVLVFVGYVFDVAQSFPAAMGMLKRMATNVQWSPVAFYHEINSTYQNFNSWSLMIVVGMAGMMLLADIYHERHDAHLGGDGVRLRDRIDRGSFVKEWVLLLACICAILLLGIYGPGYNPVKFVYANF